MKRTTTDPSARAAEAAGLRYVTDFGPGIRRERAGRKAFRYVDPSSRIANYSGTQSSDAIPVCLKVR